LRLPILRDKPFFYDLELNAAARISDYTTVGKTWTWNANAIWAPVKDVRFRGTYARAVRAPNIGELFSPQSQTFEFIDDPCDIHNLNNGSSNRAANCATLLTGLGVNPAIFTDPNSASIAGLQHGNPSLSEETAKSWTAGVVLQPRFIRGLNLSFDWYHITIASAINQATAEQVAEHCVDAADLNNVFCNEISREVGTGAITGFLLQPENVAAFRTSGLDFNLAYRLDAADIGLGPRAGTFNVRVFGNYLHKLSFVPAPGAEPENDRGTQFAPKWQFTFDLTWNVDPITVNYGFNFWSKTLRYSHNEVAGDPDIASKANKFYDGRHTHDFRIAYDIDDKKYQFYVGVNNIFDQKPDLATYYPVSPLGRFLYAGFKANFEDVFGGK
jgi:iron complex outermembrane receptor protein